MQRIERSLFVSWYSSDACHALRQRVGVTHAYLVVSYTKLAFYVKDERYTNLMV